MFCQTCKTKLEEGAPFCKICGRSTSLIDPVTFSADPVAAEKKLPALVKCQNCGYEGRGEFARSKLIQVLAWICIFVFVPFTIIYFLTTKKYGCPKCKSVSLSFKNRKGEFINQ